MGRDRQHREPTAEEVWACIYLVAAVGLAVLSGFLQGCLWG